MEITNPDKRIFPGHTKTDLVGHYARVAARMVPHLRRRPVTLERYPDGIEADGFMQKHASSHFPESVARVELPKKGGTVVHPVVDTAEALTYLANQGTVTFHISQSRAPAVDRPDRLVIDLDPPAGEVAAARHAAGVVREVLTELGVPAGIMTTGSKGFHVVAHLEPDTDFPAVGHASRLLAMLVAARHPARLTTEFRIEERKRRVFIDWLRNGFGSMAVAPWSLRPRPKAPVAAPIRWEDLDTTEPDGWTLDSVADLVVEGDPLVELEPVSAQELCSRVEHAAAEAGVSAEEPFNRFR